MANRGGPLALTCLPNRIILFLTQLIEIFPVLQIEVDLKKEWSYGYPRWLSQVVMHNNNQQNT